jgi:hypothetical protein
MFLTVGDKPALWESQLPADVLRLPDELSRVDALLDERATRHHAGRQEANGHSERLRAFKPSANVRSPVCRPPVPFALVSGLLEPLVQLARVRLASLVGLAKSMGLVDGIHSCGWRRPPALNGPEGVEALVKRLSSRRFSNDVEGSG